MSHARGGKRFDGGSATAKINTGWMTSTIAANSGKDSGFGSTQRNDAGKSVPAADPSKGGSGLRASESKGENGSLAPPSIQSLCVQILTKGYVNSFVDFFYLTHHSSDRPSADIPTHQLADVQQNLMNAEKAHRRSDTGRILDAYENLANYFQGNRDHRTAIYFYEKCLDIAETTGNLGQQCVANNNLGVTHDAMGEMGLAARFHEKHLQISQQMGEEDRIIYANRQLLDVYRRYAEQFEERNDIVSAIEYYDKCMQASIDCGDQHNEGVAAYRLGIAHANSNNIQQAIKWQLRYLDICKQTGEVSGEGAACSALAACYQVTKDMDKAMHYLERYHDVSVQKKEYRQQAEACSALGVLAATSGKHDKAVAYFEKAFEIARGLKDRRLMDAARINLGLSRGNVGLPTYARAINEDLNTLLNWKSKRIDFK